MPKAAAHAATKGAAPLRNENGSAKVSHGSGRIVLRQAKKNFATLALSIFRERGGIFTAQ